MKFARLFLIGIMLVVAGVDAWLIMGAGAEGRLALASLLWVLTGPLVATALCVLVFSYTKVDRQNGQLVLDRNSLYVKLVGGMWSEKKKPWPGEQVSICALFWASVVPIGMLMFTAWILLGAVPYAITHAVMNPPRFGGVSMPSNETWATGGVIVGGIIFFFVSLGGGIALSAKVKNGLGKILIAGACFLTALLVIISTTSVSSLMGDKHLPFREAVATYWWGFKEYSPSVLMWVGIGIAGLAAAVGVVLLIVLAITSLRKTIVGELAIGMWKAFKDKACPIVKISGEIPVVVEDKPAEPPPEPVEPAKS
ncbi:MAG: hypothetical protein AAB389_04715 [Patescibacteria group bacterium]